MNDNYSAPSGGTIYAGMIAPDSVPSWRRGLALYETVAIPHVGALSTINPENNPAINPNYPASAPWRGNVGFPALMSAYCGAAWDDSTGEFWFPISFGHQDGADNAPYMGQVIAEQIQWRMVRPPSGAIGFPAVNFNDGQEATGLYSDGRLRAVHSYSYGCAVNGKVYAAALVGQYPLGQTIKRWVVEIDKTTGEYTLICDYTTAQTNINSGYGGAAIDPTRNKMFISGRGTTRLVAVDLTARTFVNIGSLNDIFGEYHSVVYAPEVDRIIFATAQSAANYLAKRGLAVLNPANNSVVYPACDNFPAFLGNAVGAAWVGDAMWLWDNTTDTNTFAVLTPSNPADLSQPWTVSTITSTGDTITARASAGTYNRLQYSARLGGLLLINAVNQQMYFTRTN